MSSDGQAWPLLHRWVTFMADAGTAPPDGVLPVGHESGAHPDFVVGRALVYVDGSDLRERRADRDHSIADRVREEGFRIVRFGHPDDWPRTMDDFAEVLGQGAEADWLPVAAAITKREALTGSSRSDSVPADDATAPVPAAPRRPLPKNVERVLDILDSHHEPMTVDELADELLEEGIRMAGDLIRRLPERFPRELALLEGGRIGLADWTPIDSSEASIPLRSSGLASVASVRPLSLDAVGVIDIETTGLDPAANRLVQVAFENLGTGERWSAWVDDVDGSADLTVPVMVASPPPEAERIPAASALAELARRLGGCEALAGHRVESFDLPFLAAVAGRIGLPWQVPAVVLDSHVLSLVVEPGLSARSLSDLVHHYGIPHEVAHEAASDAAATAELIRVLLSKVDPQDDSWRLARDLLRRGGSGWPAIIGIPDWSSDDDLGSALEIPVDPLVRPGSGPRHTSAAAAEIAGFATLQTEVEGFRARPQQRLLSQAIASTIDQSGRLVAEAPTGSGKSLAYLVPAAGHASRRGNPVVIATHTKVLQRQLRRDALRLRELGLLPSPFRQIYGVGNYVCTRELASGIAGTEEGATEITGNGWIAAAVAVRALATVESGVWDDVGDRLLQLTDRAYRSTRSRLHTTSHSCDRAHCDWAARCPLMTRLVGLADDPGVISANHALLAAWATLAGEGRPAPGDVLGEGKSVVVFDEAHNLEDSLTAAWTEETGSMDISLVVASVFGRYGPVRAMETAARSMGRQLAALGPLRDRRSIAHLRNEELVEAAKDYLTEFAGSDTVVSLLPGVVNRRVEFRRLANACGALARALNDLRYGVLSAYEELVGADPVNNGGGGRNLARRVFGAIEDLAKRSDLLYAIRDLAEPHRFLHLLAWEEDREEDPQADGRRDVSLSKVPIEIRDEFMQGIVNRARSMVLTSATLTVDQRFDFLSDRLGIAVAEEGGQAEGGAFRALRVSSPFDHDSQAMAVLTSHLPVPLPTSQKAFCQELAADHIGFLSLTGGRTLGLFAARVRMEAVAAGVRTRERELSDRGVQLLVQGEGSISEIERRFRQELGTSVYGLASFWEGFDAPGETLSYLMIEKPPYPHPGDALVAARQRLITERGGDPFLDYVVPRTAIRLAQGFGRLIRSEDDRGVALFADRRLALPSQANHLLLSALGTDNIVLTTGRDEAWSTAIEFVTGTAPDVSEAIAAPADRVQVLLDQLRLEDGEDPEVKLQTAAREIFGIDALRPFQLAMMRALLEGRDALGFVPTGSGKSLCFQLPALLHPRQLPTVVVSPLVALIKDQVDELRSRLGLRGVVGITGQTTVAERTETLRDLAEGRVQLLYVSPERLVRDGNLQEALLRQELGALVIDEAHCVSSWGHDFRPEFRLVAKAVLDFKRAPRLGLTATATPEVETDLIETLQLVDPVIHREPVDRPDLRFSVMELESERDRTQELLRLVTANRDVPGIVYAGRRDTTEQLAYLLRQAGFSARAYHAGLVPEQREAIQESYLDGVTQIVVATKAFGMGINKPDIAWVVHFDLPEALESYAQEAGRAARDPSLEGIAALFYTRRDIARRKGQVGKVAEHHRPQAAQLLLDVISRTPARGPHHVFDPAEVAEDAGLDLDQLNVLVAWLERSGNLDRRRDATARGMVHVGRREPADPEERLAFFRILRQKLGAHPGQQKQIDFGEAEDRFGLPPDDLERRLLDWSFERLVDFRSTVRHWRVALIDHSLHQKEFSALLASHERLDHRRLGTMVRYARGRTCRRVMIAESFGDSVARCVDSPSALRCDVCDAEIDGRSAPRWHDTALAAVPDAESLVDVNRTVLLTLAWSSRFEKGNYSEAGLKVALLGNDTIGGRPLGRGLLNCPQFGALRFVRGADAAFDKAVGRLVDGGLAERSEAKGREGRGYATLQLTERGRAEVGGRNHDR